MLLLDKHICIYIYGKKISVIYSNVFLGSVWNVATRSIFYHSQRISLAWYFNEFLDLSSFIYLRQSCKTILQIKYVPCFDDAETLHRWSRRYKVGYRFEDDSFVFYAWLCSFVTACSTETFICNSSGRTLSSNIEWSPQDRAWQKWQRPCQRYYKLVESSSGCQLNRWAW